MRIRLGILDGDTLYKTRLINYFNANYADKLEIFSFSDTAALRQYMAGKRLDVILAGESSVPDPKQIPEGSAFAYWSEAANVDSIRNIRTVCKYQKAELIYKEILGLYAESESNITSYRMGNGEKSMVLTFLGAAGGVGTSTAAAGCAFYFAQHGKKVLYLDLTELGQTGLYFNGEGNATLSEALYAIKSNHANLFLKLESMVKRDTSGVSFYESCRVALDFRDATADNLTTLIRCMSESKSFDYLVIDTDSLMTAKQEAILAASTAVILVSDGTQTSNQKLARLAQAYRLEDSRKSNAARKLMLLYNRFHTGAQKVAPMEDVPELGGINVYKNGSPAAIAAAIAGKPVFEQFLQRTEG